MCIIIVNKSQELIKHEFLQTAINAHKDGYGLSYIKDNKIEIFKTMKGEEFFNKYYELRPEHMNSPFLLHCRTATQGAKNLESCHPFKVNENLVIAHNGILSDFSNKEHKNLYPEKSDTIIFNEKILQKLPEGFQNNSAISFILEDYLSYTNRLVLMDNAGNLTIYNQQKGEKDSVGNWYSNGSYQPTQIIKYIYKQGNFDSMEEQTIIDSYELCQICYSDLHTKNEKEKKKCIECLIKQVSKNKTCINHVLVFLSFKEEFKKGKCLSCIQEDEKSPRCHVRHCNQILVFPKEIECNKCHAHNGGFV